MAGNYSRRYQWTILATVSVARVVYSLNWYTLSPGLTQVGTTFHASIQGLGLLESAFLAGGGIFQVPAAYAAARWNAKLLIVSGLLLIGVANGLGAFAPSLTVLIFFRFLLGIGAAMFFSPAIIVVTPLFAKERQGLALGIYTAAFNVGGSIALLGWVYVVQALGWRLALLSGAVFAFPLSLALFLVIKHSEKELGQASTDPWKSVVGVLKNRQTWLIGSGIIGMWSASYAISQFLPYFETKVNLLSPEYAGLLASLVLILPIPGALIGGWLSDLLKNRKAFLIYPTIVFGVGTALIGFSDFNESFVLLSVIGLLESFAFVAMYAAPFQMPDLKFDQKSMSISLMNSIQISSAFVLPILFAGVATSYGYTSAWIVAGVFTLAFVPFLLMVREPFKNANSTPEITTRA